MLIVTEQTAAATVQTQKSLTEELANVRHHLPRARSPLSIDASVRLMDHFNESSFHTWIKDQTNARISSRHLGRIMIDYTPEQVAAGLRWLFEDWQLISIAVILRVVLIDMEVEKRKRDAILRLITMGWERKHVQHLFFLLRSPVEKLF